MSLHISADSSAETKQQREAKIKSTLKKKHFSWFEDDSRKKTKHKHWKHSENEKYVQFLIQNSHLFQKEREDKRTMKINVVMSKCIRSKNSTQCRSHHQKMLLSYKSIKGIIENFSKNGDFTEFDENESQMGNEAMQMVEMQNCFEDEEKPAMPLTLFDVLNDECLGFSDGQSLDATIFSF